MITVIFGENIALSRDFYFKEKQKATYPINLEGGSFTITDLSQVLKSSELFGGGKTVFIEDLFAKRKKGKDLDAILSYIKNNGKDTNIFLWDSKSPSNKQLNLLGEIDVKKFDFPKEIFSFLDSIFPGNAKRSIELFQKTLITENSEFIFFMIVRHFRIILGLNADPQNQIDEVKKLAFWQTDRLNKQKKLFETDFLLDFYNKLFEIEKGLKTGSLVVSLSDAIDFLLSNL